MTGALVMLGIVVAVVAAALWMSGAVDEARRDGAVRLGQGREED